jgi:excinuclease ABC subunit C
MKVCSKAHRFEDAAKLRDQIMAVQSLGYKSSVDTIAGELRGLQHAIGLKALPERIEAFDISNISGQEATGSMVSFWHGRPDKENYRRFRIKTVRGIDDYRMLAEVVTRRYRRLRDEGSLLPDLVLIDGGKGHLAVAVRQLAELGVVVPVISIAKEQEQVFTPFSPEPLSVGADSPAVTLLRRVRDEAHRFAVAYHHVLHRKKIIGR